MWLPAYVDDQLLKGGKIHRAAILGLAGGVWATSTGFNVWCLLIWLLVASLTFLVLQSFDAAQP